MRLLLGRGLQFFAAVQMKQVRNSLKQNCSQERHRTAQSLCAYWLRGARRCALGSNTVVSARSNALRLIKSLTIWSATISSHSHRLSHRSDRETLNSWSVCAPSLPLRFTFWSAKLSLVVRGERVIGRAYLRPCGAVGADATSNRMLAQPRIRARDGRRHAT